MTAITGSIRSLSRGIWIVLCLLIAGMVILQYFAVNQPFPHQAENYARYPA